MNDTEAEKTHTKISTAISLVNRFIAGDTLQQKDYDGYIDVKIRFSDKNYTYGIIHDIFDSPENFRIKPKEAYRPWLQSEALCKHVAIKSSPSTITTLITTTPEHAYFLSVPITYEILLKDYIQINGQPCGVKL